MRLTMFSAALTSLICAAPPLLAEVPRVVADTPVAHSLVSQVMGDLGTPEILLGQGSDPHHAQLRPSQARAIVRADLVVWTSADLSPWLDEVITSLAPDVALELASVEGVYRQPYAENQLLAEADDHDDHDDHEGHDDHDDHDDHEDDDHEGHDDHAGHDHEGDDPHQWMHPENAQVWIDAIAAQLTELDPDNAATYAENAANARAAIDQLSSDIAAVLAPVQGVGLVMGHDAYGYFATRFDLNILGSVAAGDAVDPSAARISALRAALHEADATCLFPEVNHPDAYVSLTAEDQGLRLGTPLDPAGVMLEPGPALYAESLMGLARAFAECASRDG